MADYILRAENPSKIQPGGKVYLTESGSWSMHKRDAKIFSAKTKANEAKKSADLECEIITPDVDTQQAVEDTIN
jgi:hypothetical protein